MTSLISFVFSLTGLTALVAFTAVWVLLRPGSRVARRALAAAVLGFVLVSSYVVPYALSRSLAGSYGSVQPGQILSGRTGVVLLGTGNSEAIAWDGTSVPVVDPVTASRIAEAARVYRLAPEAWVISSAGVVDGRPGGRSGGAIMRDLLIASGIPGERVLVEGASRNTRDEATMVPVMLGSLNVQHVVIVTSHVHMRRALGAFRAAGVAAVPSTARDPFLQYGWLWWLTPHQDGITLSGSLVHECLGIVAYSWRGWMK